MDSTLLWNNGDMMCPISKGDPVLNSDPRVLQQLIRVERLNGKTFRFVNHRCYFKEVQDEVQPYMRRILAKWMMEVCEEQGMEDIVFPLATSYVDRFLSCVRIQKIQLQLLGAVCLLIASKLRQCRSLTVDALIYYTDYSVSTQDITTWEMLVLRSLKWDMASVIASDFVDPLLSRLDVDREDLVRRHTHTFIALCATEEKFLAYSPSLLAVSCVAVAINGLTWLQKPWKSSLELVMKLTELTDINTKYVQTCMKDIEDLLALNIAQLQQTVSKTTSSTSNKVTCSIAANGQPETPTDVQDVLF